MKVTIFNTFYRKKILEYPKYKVNINIQVEYILKGLDNIVTEKELFTIRSYNFIISRVVSKKSLNFF